MRAMWIAPVILLALSCGDATAPIPDANFSQTVPATLTVGIGETVVFSGIEITFSRVLEDSRCPIDVLCPWAGNAAIELGVGPNVGGDGPTIQLVLNSMQGPREGEAWGLRITLLEVRPDAISTEPIPPDAYVVVLKVERVGSGASTRSHHSPRYS